jgi:hypothetical protein
MLRAFEKIAYTIVSSSMIISSKAPVAVEFVFHHTKLYHSFSAGYIVLDKIIFHQFGTVSLVTVVVPLLGVTAKVSV